MCSVAQDAHHHTLDLENDSPTYMEHSNDNTSRINRDRVDQRLRQQIEAELFVIFVKVLFYLSQNSNCNLKERLTIVIVNVIAIRSFLKLMSSYNVSLKHLYRLWRTV